jgi:hypothetical protein
MELVPKDPQPWRRMLKERVLDSLVEPMLLADYWEYEPRYTEEGCRVGYLLVPTYPCSNELPPASAQAYKAWTEEECIDPIQVVTVTVDPWDGKADVVWHRAEPTDPHPIVDVLGTLFDTHIDLHGTGAVRVARGIPVEQARLVAELLLLIPVRDSAADDE